MYYVVYTDDPDFDKVDGITYRKSSPFYGVVSGAHGVFLDGSYPEILEAYQAANVEILASAPTSPNPVNPSGPIAWADIEGKPAVIGAGATQAAARTAIGAGTSSLVVGTSASQAAAGNHNHAIAADAASGLAAAANLQAGFVALSARIKVLEDAAPAG